LIKNKKTKIILIACIVLIIIVAFISLMSNFRKDLKGSGYIPPTNIKTQNIHINEITTYEESIENGKVEIDGIYYDIHNIYEMLNIYNSDGDVVETVYINDDSKARIEFIYKNNQIIKEKRYSNDEFESTTYYRYENDLLLEQTTVDKSGLKTRIEYSYGAKTRKLTHYNSDNDISFIATEYLDDDGNIIKGVITTEDGEVTDTTTMYYDNDLLVKSIRKRDGGAINTFNIEYNNVGDKIKEYSILSHQKDDFLMVNLYDIEYNENLLPKIITIYQVHSKITAEDARKYQ
jgi:hypothetical protein